SCPPFVSQAPYMVILACSGWRCPAPAPPCRHAIPHPRLPLQPRTPCRIGRSVSYGMLHVPMPERVLNQPRIGPLVGQGIAVGMAQHVPCASTASPARRPYARIISQAILRLKGRHRSLRKTVSVSSCIWVRSASQALIACNASPRRGCVVDSRLSAVAHGAPGSQYPPETRAIRRPPTRATHSEHQQPEAAVTGLVAGTLRGRDELLDFGDNQVFAGMHHFVQC